MGVHNQFVEERAGKEKRKGGKERKEKEKKERKRSSDGRNSLDQGVKSGDSTRGYALRGRDSSYFGLLNLWAIALG